MRDVVYMIVEVNSGMNEFYLLKKVRRTGLYIREQFEDNIRDYLEWKKYLKTATLGNLWGPEAELMRKRYRLECDAGKEFIKTFFKNNAVDIFVDLLMNEIETLEDVEELETPNS